MKTTRLCRICGDPFESSRRDRVYCGGKCRKAAWRGVKPAPPVPRSLPGPIERATRVVLAAEGADVAADVAVAALRCAAALDDPQTPPSALVPLSRTLGDLAREMRERFVQRQKEEETDERPV